MLNQATTWLYPGSIFIIGLAIMLFGTIKTWIWRNYPGRVIAWGSVVDLGLALAGLGLGSAAGIAGCILLLLYHGTVRALALLAWFAICGEHRLNEDKQILNSAMSRQPIFTIIFCFSLVAALGTSIFLTPDGQHLAIHALASTGGLVSILLMALSQIVLIWITADLVLAACFRGDSARFSFKWPSFKQHRVIYIMTGVVIGMGFFRIWLQYLVSSLVGQPVPFMETFWNWPSWLLCWGGFLVVLPIIPKKWISIYVALLNALALLLVLLTITNPLARLFGLLITGMGLVLTVYSIAYINEDGRKNWYWFLLLATFGSLLGLVTAENLASFAVFWEIMSWVFFGLLAYEGSQAARSVARKYITICGGAAYVMIPGLYLLGGDFTPYSQVMNFVNVQPTVMLFMASSLCLIGFAAKAGLFPLYAWLPSAYAVPAPVSAALSGLLTKMGVFGLVLLLFVLIGQPKLYAGGDIFNFAPLGLLVTILGLITMGIGEVMALRQEDLKKMLAYSTMGQIGEIVTVLGICSWLSTVAALSHLLNHAIIKDLLFFCAGALILRTGSRKLSDLSGYVSHMPWTIGCMAIGLIAIMGLPPFNGFVSKYLMIVACMQAGHWFLALAILAASLVGAIYYLRILRTLLLDKPDKPRQAIVEVSWIMRAPILFLAGLCVLLGLAPMLGLNLILPVLAMFVDLGKLMPGALPDLGVAWPSFVLLPMLGAICPFILRKHRSLAAVSAVVILVLTTLLVLVNAASLDSLSFYMALVIPVVGALNLVYAVGYMEHSHTQWRFYCFFLLMLGGLLGVTTSRDLFSFFTFWELMSSWALYFVIGHEATKEALHEAFKYFLFNLAGSAFIFMGIGLLVGAAGISQFSQLGLVMQSFAPGLAATIIALFVLGFCLKAAQVTLFVDWQMYPTLAPAPVSGYMSAVVLKIAVFALVKMFIVLGSGNQALFYQEQIMYIVAWAAAFTLLYGAYKAMLQTKLKLVFAWSTVSQLGYIVLGVSLGTSLGLAGGLLHLVNHMFFKDLLLLMVGAVMFKTHVETVEHLGGLGRKMPQTMACFFIGALAAIGVPPTSGFTSKWIIYQALMEQGDVLLAIIALLGSVVTLAYFVRFMHLVFLGRAAAVPSPIGFASSEVKSASEIQEAPLIMRVPMFILAAIVIISGIFPGIFLLPINAALVEYDFASLDVAFFGLRIGSGAWNASIMSLLLVVALGLCYLGLAFVLKRVPLRVSDVHACGHDSSKDDLRIPPDALYSSFTRLIPVPKFLTRKQGKNS